MGWLSDTLGGIGDFFGVGDLLGGIGGGLDYAQQRKDSKKAQMRQYEQALYMSNTAHQREVADLRAAGLNPVLSVMGGSGASSAMPSVSQLPHSDSSGVARAQLREQKRLNSAAIEKSAAEAASARAVAANQAEQAKTEATKRQLNLASVALSTAHQLEAEAQASRTRNSERIDSARWTADSQMGYEEWRKKKRQNEFFDWVKSRKDPLFYNQARALEMFGASAFQILFGQSLLWQDQMDSWYHDWNDKGKRFLRWEGDTLKKGIKGLGKGLGNASRFL